MLTVEQLINRLKSFPPSYKVKIEIPDTEGILVGEPYDSSNVYKAYKAGEPRVVICCEENYS